MWHLSWSQKLQQTWSGFKAKTCDNMYWVSMKAVLLTILHLFSSLVHLFQTGVPTLKEKFPSEIQTCCNFTFQKYLVCSSMLHPMSTTHSPIFEFKYLPLDPYHSITYSHWTAYNTGNVFPLKSWLYKNVDCNFFGGSHLISSLKIIY